MSQQTAHCTKDSVTPATVWAFENILAGFIDQLHRRIHVCTRSPVTDSRFRHKGDEQPVALGDFF